MNEPLWSSIGYNGDLMGLDDADGISKMVKNILNNLGFLWGFKPIGSPILAILGVATAALLEPHIEPLPHIEKFGKVSQ